MTALGHLGDLYFIELTRPLGRREVMTCEAYVEMPLAELRHTHARPVSRTEVIRQRAQARRP